MTDYAKSDASTVVMEHVYSILPGGAFPIYLVLGGSHAYGLDRPDSDKDYRGVFMPGERHFFGLADQDGPYEKKQPDIVMQSLAKFVKLALGANPNILEQLFIPKQEQLGCWEGMVHILDDRHLFLSRRAHKSYMGYAYSQLSKLKSGGTRNLGEKRKALREQFGYDTKNAMHCVRLLLQGREILESGELTVRCDETTRVLLLDIRDGRWAYENVLELAENYMTEINRALEHSPLPPDPPVDCIEASLMDVQAEYLAQRKPWRVNK